MMNLNLSTMSAVSVVVVVMAAVTSLLSAADHAINFRWPIDEEPGDGAVVGDLRRSLGPYIDEAVIGDYEYRLLPRPGQDLAGLELDRVTGVVRSRPGGSGGRGAAVLDRETLCPRPGTSTGGQQEDGAVARHRHRHHGGGGGSGGELRKTGQQHQDKECVLELSVGLMRNLQLEQVSPSVCLSACL